MKIEVLIEAQALEFFRRQPPAARKKLRAALHAIGEGKDFPETLEDELDGFYKTKVDDYRLILQSVFAKNGPRFRVVFAERRSAVYKIFSQMLGLE